jgi:hypothetical protein
MVLRNRFLLFHQHRSLHPLYYSSFNTLHVQTGRDIDVMPFWPMRPTFALDSHDTRDGTIILISLYSACHELHVRVIYLSIIPLVLRLIVTLR